MPSRLGHERQAEAGAAGRGGALRGVPMVPPVAVETDGNKPGPGRPAMATLARLQARSSFLESQYYFRNRVVDEFRKKEYDAAVKIQSWFRGCQVRACIRYWNKVVTVIQKWWRGYLGRKYFQLVVQVAHYTMKMNFYNAMAVRIQRWWRGFKIRRYCYNYYCLKEYLNAVAGINDMVREALEEFTKIKEREERKAALEREEMRRDDQARKTHYLLSTKQIPGVYNSPFRKEPDPWELQLQKVKPLTTHPHSKAKKYSRTLASAQSLSQCASLPPIDRKQCQGPFRAINEVLEQRYKPLEPTLRVAEPFNHLKLAREEYRREEQMRNVQDKIFLPFSSYHKNEKYDPLIHSSSKYRPDYGLKHFREENPQKWISDKDFRTILPSFELFSKYGKLYSKAGQII